MKAGDTVRLNSGGPLMTVRELDDIGAMCVWFDKDQKLQEKYLNQNVLTVE